MDNYEQMNDTTMRDYIRVLFRHKGVILTTILTVCTTVFIGLKLKTNMYVSQVKMLITAEKQVEATYYREMGDRNVQQTLTQSEIVKSNPVLTRVVQSLALNKRPLDDEKKFSSPLKGIFVDHQARDLTQKLSPLAEEQRQGFLFRMAVDSLRESISVEPIRDTNMFTISVKDYNPVAAAYIANVVSRSYVMFDLEQQLAELKLKYGDKHPTVNLIKDSITQLGKTLSGEPLNDVEAIGPASVKIIEQASVPMKPSGPPKILTMILAVLMSIFLAVMLAFVFEYIDQSFRNPQDIKKTLNISVLGSIPKKGYFDKELVKQTKKETLYTHAYQMLSDQIYLLCKDKGLKSILIAPISTLEGTSGIVANLGHYLSEVFHHKTLIIDTDLRNPAMHKIFKASQATGLISIIKDHTALKDAVQSAKTDLDVLTAIKTDTNPIALLDSIEMENLIKESKEKYEIVLVHGGNIKDSKETALLAKRMDGVILIMNEGVSRRQVIQEAIGSLDRKHVNILGIVLNNRTFPIPKAIYEKL